MSGRSSRLFLALLAGGSVLVSQAAQAEPPRGNMGGGFIEMLMTGQSPGQRRQGAPSYQAPAQPGYFARSGTPAVYPQPGLRRRSDRVMYQAPVADPMAAGSVVAPAMMANARIDDPYAQGGIAPPRGAQQNYVTAPVQPAFDPRFEKQDVAYNGPYAAGTLVIDTPQRFLYLVQGNGRALRYGIGVGRPGFEWAGAKTVSMKREWPDWRPPSEMLKRRPDLPTYMAGGPENPLGARAMYLGSSLYRIHGTNEPETIGRAVSSGCIRMRNEDVVDLYGRVKVGTKVIVM